MNKNFVDRMGYGGMESSQKLFKRRALLTSAGILTSMLVVNPTELFAQTEHSDGARKINFSGRQRMLIQRAGKFVCLAYLSANPIPHLTAAEQTLALHQQTETGLRDGDPELGLDQEVNASVVRALTQASRAFAPYGQTIRDAIESRAVTHEHVQSISELNEYALSEMHAAVNLIERVYRSAELSDQMAMLINISGRQRMFTQRMVLLLCLTRSDVDAIENRQELFTVLNRFRVSQRILRRVTPVVLQGEALLRISQRLQTVEEDSTALLQNISLAAQPPGDQSNAELLQIDQQSEEILNRMNEIVLLYEGAVA